MQIVGVGRSKAVELYNMGATSKKKLKKMVEKNKIQVNDKIKLGLKYDGVFEINIPRKEIDKIYKMLTKIVNNINKEEKLNELIKSIVEAKILTGDGLIIIHRNKKIEENLDEKLKIIDARYYGLSKIIFATY